MGDMNGMEVENATKNGGKFHRGLTIFGPLALVAFILVGLLFYIYGLNMVWGSRMIDDRDAVATVCAKALYTQVKDCYESQGRDIPADKEYLVRAVCSKDGLVNEPCELLPQSETNAYYSSQWKTTFSVAVIFRDSVPA